MAALADNIFLKKYLAKRVRTQVVLLVLFALVAGLWTSAVLLPNVELMTDKYSRVNATATSEGIGTVTEGTRRNRHIEKQRYVDFEFTLNGKTEHDRVYDDNIKVGDKVDLIVNEGNKTLLTEEPGKPGFWAWTGLIVGPLILAGLVMGFVSSRRNSKKLRAFDPGAATGRFTVSVHSAAHKVINEKAKAKPGNLNLVLSSHVTASAAPKFQVGSQVELVSLASASPQANELRAHLEVAMLDPDEAAGFVFVRDPQGGPWWPAELKPVSAVQPA